MLETSSRAQVAPQYGVVDPYASADTEWTKLDVFHPHLVGIGEAA